MLLPFFPRTVAFAWPFSITKASWPMSPCFISTVPSEISTSLESAAIRARSRLLQPENS